MESGTSRGGFGGPTHSLTLCCASRHEWSSVARARSLGSQVRLRSARARARAPKRAAKGTRRPTSGDD